MNLMHVVTTATVLAVAGAASQLPAAEERTMTEVVQGNNGFAIDLYGQLRHQPGNLFLSPYSISTALAMTYGGARGETQTQMAKVLRFGLSEEQLHTSFAAIQDRLSGAGSQADYQLSIANRLWGQKSHPFLQSYRKLTADYYKAPVEELDFAQTEASRSTINRWVEEQTHEKIKDLLPAGSLAADTRLVLTNAIYFLGNWAHPFNKSATQDAPFHAAGGDVTAAMMYQKGHFRWMSAEGVQLLELPYKGQRLSMLALLPDRPDGLLTLEDSLSAEKVARWLDAARNREVNVHLPRIKMTSQFQLNESLEALGMTLPFTRQADFSGMDGHRDLFISAVIHKAFVDVNELGTEAAAATGITMKALAMRGPPPVEFRADHPFLLLIRDNQTGSLLFFGRVTRPDK